MGNIPCSRQSRADDEGEPVHDELENEVEDKFSRMVARRGSTIVAKKNGDGNYVAHVDSRGYFAKLMATSVVPCSIGQKELHMSTTILNKIDDMWLDASFGSKPRKITLPRALTRESITLENFKLGAGNFGVVRKGRLRSRDYPAGIDVAVKHMRLKENHTDADIEQFKSDFVKEAMITAQLQHRNVICIFGICLSEHDTHPPMIVLSLCEFGDLLSYLKRRKKSGRLLDPTDLGNICYQISCGMAHLARCAFVHRDLACRNVLLTRHGICKIADLGMGESPSDDSDSGGAERREPLPVRWCSPEVLLCRQFSHASDVWSYCVTTWEVYTYGKVPYGKMWLSAVLASVAHDNLHPLRPEYCPEHLWDTVFAQGFEEDPTDRPTFQQFKQLLRAFAATPLNLPVEDIDARFALKSKAADYKRGSIRSRLGSFWRSNSAESATSDLDTDIDYSPTSINEDSGNATSFESETDNSGSDVVGGSGDGHVYEYTENLYTALRVPQKNHDSSEAARKNKTAAAKRKGDTTISFDASPQSSRKEVAGGYISHDQRHLMAQVSDIEEAQDMFKLTQRQVKLIDKFWTRLAAPGRRGGGGLQDFGLQFFSFVFGIHPEAAHLFGCESDIVTKLSQGTHASDPSAQSFIQHTRRVFVVLTSLVGMLDKPHELGEFLYQMGLRHAKYQIKLVYVDAMRAGLLHTVRRMAGDTVDAATWVAFESFMDIFVAYVKRGLSDHVPETPAQTTGTPTAMTTPPPATPPDVSQPNEVATARVPAAPSSPLARRSTSAGTPLAQDTFDGHGEYIQTEIGDRGTPRGNRSHVNSTTPSPRKQLPIADAVICTEHDADTIEVVPGSAVAALPCPHTSSPGRTNVLDCVDHDDIAKKTAQSSRRQTGGMTKKSHTKQRVSVV